MDIQELYLELESDEELATALGQQLVKVLNPQIDKRGYIGTDFGPKTVAGYAKVIAYTIATNTPRLLP